MFKNDFPDGYGVLKSADGTIYEGDFYKGKRNGSGLLIKPDGTRYQGTFIDDVLKD
jgi:hypothetical protein